MYISNFVYSSVDGHLDCFHLLATVNNAAIHRCTYNYLSPWVFYFLINLFIWPCWVLVVAYRIFFFLIF